MASDITDPLETGPPPERVNYENGVLLDEKDFTDEQTYFRGRLGRILAFLHGAGTVAGLEVVETEPGSHIVMVKPGLAIDPIGRLIEVGEAYCIRAPLWFAEQEEQALSESFAGGGANAVVADLFVRFDACIRGMTPYFGVGNTEGTDAFTHERLLDGAKFEMQVKTDFGAAEPGPFPFGGFDPASPANLEEALKAIRNHKYKMPWNMSGETGEDDMRVLLSRIFLPAAQSPMAYDTNGQIVVDDSVRLLSLTTTELLWLAETLRGD